MHDTTLPEKGAEKKRWAISMRSGASGMLLAAWGMEGGDDLLTSALRTRPRLRPEPDRDQFFAIITQEEGKGFGARNRSVVLINDRLRTEPRRGNVPTQRGLWRETRVVAQKGEEEEKRVARRPSPAEQLVN